MKVRAVVVIPSRITYFQSTVFPEAMSIYWFGQRRDVRDKTTIFLIVGFSLMAIRLTDEKSLSHPASHHIDIQ